MDRARIRNSSPAALSRAKLRSRISLARRVSVARVISPSERAKLARWPAMILGGREPGPDIRREIRN